MATTQVLSERSSNTTTQIKHLSAHARSRSISMSQLPRSFEHGEEFLAQSAAAAYQNNPAYLAIEKETLSAVAPFLEICKKRERAASSSSSTPISSRSYLHNRRKSSVSSIDLGSSPVKVQLDLNSSPVKLPDKTVTPGFSIFEDARSYWRGGISSLPASVIPEDSLPDNTKCERDSLGFKISRRRSENTSSSQDMSSSDQEPLQDYSDFANNHASAPVTCLPAHLHALGPAYSLAATTQQLELMQNRLKPASPHKLSGTSMIPLVSPDGAFLLTKFIYDSVRLYSPTRQELDEKVRLQKDLEAVLQAVQPTASLVLFGSVKNGLALANADLDLMVVDKSSLENQLHDVQVDLPGLYAEALRAQGYSVRLMTKTRIPLIKIQREYVAGAFSVDISFDNPLAIHNTKLMATYAACDPRFGILVMFIKLWARARRINDAFSGTLKSYGYMIMLVYYLQNKVTPALLPNLQMIAAPGRPVAAEELECQGYDIWYAKDVTRMHAIQQNFQSVGELLEGFFSHFAYEFDYRDWVISINVLGGLQTKEAKRWTQLVEHLNESGSARVKDRFILCVADPFEISHNVARTVTRAGLYEIRGSTMAAIRAIRANKLTDLLTPSL